jgi:hypothetical protein
MATKGKRDGEKSRDRDSNWVEAELRILVEFMRENSVSYLK